MKKDRCKAIRRDRGWGKWKCQAGDHYSAQSIITMGERGPDFRIFQDKTEIGLLCENSQSGYVNFFKKDMYYLFIWPSQVSVAALSAGSHYGRSRPWRGHEENTGQARPSGIPSMRRSWGKYLTGKAVWDKGPSRLASASTPPCILPAFLLLFLFALLWILVLPAESSPAPLSLNKDQLKS